jgi:CubicO group peptidase (beta-lactamase class C family)
MRKSLFIVLFFSLSIPADTQTWADTSAAIDRVMSMYAADKPGVQLSIARDGRILYSKAFGMADMEHGVAMTLDAPTEAGSVSKQFTAAAILLLAQEGKLSVNDDVRKYFPELPDYGKTIRIANLLHHTSGLRDWGAVSTITGWPRTSKNYTNDDVLSIVAAQRALNFDPGAEYGYSNSNFNLLAILVQRLSGRSLAAFTRERIFIPAGMTHTQWRDDHKRIVPGRAIAYDQKNGEFVTDMPEEDAYGNGGLLTTTEDLLKWQEFYLSGKLGGDALLKEQLRVEPLNDGKPNGYAAGLMLTFEGGKLVNINHSGSTAGYRANLEYLINLHVTIAWLANSSLLDTLKMKPAGLVRNIFHPDPVVIVKPQGSDGPVKSPPRVLPDLALISGTYWSADTRSSLFVSVQDGRLELLVKPGLRLTLIQSGPMEFDIPDWRGKARFEIDKKGSAKALYISVDRARNVKFDRIPG